MKIKFLIVLLVGLAFSSFQGQATGICNGGFEDGLSCWGSLDGDFGFKEVTSSYTDGRGITFTPSEGSSFLNLWGEEDLYQEISWKKGDQLSFDLAETVGTNPDAPGVGLSMKFIQGNELYSEYAILVSGTTLESVSHTFTEDSWEDSGLVFQAFYTSFPEGNFTNEELGRILIDNIQVTSVPLPGGVLLMATSLLFGGLSRSIKF
jgi:hypothetical protein